MSLGPILNSPVVATTLGALIARLSGGQKKTSSEEEIEEQLLRRLQEIGQQTAQGAQQAQAVAGQVHQVARQVSEEAGRALLSRPARLADVRDTMIRVAGDAKEALRFAREDGLAHPEVEQRLSDATAALTDLERYTLAPERIRRMPEQDRRAVESVVREIRRIRQDLLNARTVDQLEDAAGRAGQVATQLQVAAALSPTTPAEPYSKYAPDMERDTGCIPCGQGHLAGVAAGLRAAAKEAAERGFADPDVQARLTMVMEELDALQRYDWTPEKIQASPEAERRVLEEYAPKVQGLASKVKEVRDVAALQAVAEEAQALRQGFRQAVAATKG